MAKDKGITIYFGPEDLDELRQFTIWKTKKHAGTNNGFSMADFSVEDEADFDLKEANWLIRQHRLEDAKRREAQAEQTQRQAQVGQQRESISTLPDQAADAQQRKWAQEAEEQAKTYAEEKNAGRSGRPYITDEEKSIRDGVVSWIQRTKLRGGLGGRKALKK